MGLCKCKVVIHWEITAFKVLAFVLNINQRKDKNDQFKVSS